MEILMLIFVVLAVMASFSAVDGSDCPKGGDITLERPETGPFIEITLVSVEDATLTIYWVDASLPSDGPNPSMDKEVYQFVADEGMCVGSSGELDHIIYK
jgi:hypothetical protein